MRAWPGSFRSWQPAPWISAGLRHAGSENNRRARPLTCFKKDGLNYCTPKLGKTQIESHFHAKKLNTYSYPHDWPTHGRAVADGHNDERRSPLPTSALVRYYHSLLLRP